MPPLPHLTYLSAELGPRPQGSPANHAAAAYIQNVFEQAGLAVDYQRYACPDWSSSSTLLEAAGQPLLAAANAFSPPCNVTAPLIPVCTIAELAAADLAGKIGLLYGDLSSHPLSAKSWFLKDDHDDQVIRLLESKRPAALLTVQPNLGLLNRIIEDWELDLPSATIPHATGLHLLRELPTVHLQIHSQRAAGYAGNVVARLPGVRPERISLMAHYDTKIDTPGACDNASGVACLLTLAEQFAHTPLTYGLEFIAFSGEEYLPIGDDEYLRHAGDLGQIVAALNFDGVGHALGATSVMITAHSPAFQALAVDLARAFPGIVWVEPWPQSNHSTFSWRGVPSLAFSSAGVPCFEHLRTDTLDTLNPAKLSEAIDLAAAILTALQSQPPAWTRPEG